MHVSTISSFSPVGKEVQEKIDLETARQEVLIDVAKGDTEARIKETKDYSEQVNAERS